MIEFWSAELPWVVFAIILAGGLSAILAIELDHFCGDDDPEVQWAGRCAAKPRRASNAAARDAGYPNIDLTTPPRTATTRMPSKSCMSVHPSLPLECELQPRQRGNGAAQHLVGVQPKLVASPQEMAVRLHPSLIAPRSVSRRSSLMTASPAPACRVRPGRRSQPAPLAHESCRERASFLHRVPLWFSGTGGSGRARCRAGT